MKHQFKAFDQVLVRMDYRIHQGIQPCIWYASTFSHIEKTDDGRTMYCANAMCWDECIPYNENTAHLVGTNEPYEEPEPKVWQIMSAGYNKLLTSEELTNFIQNAVINNKDVTDFRIRYLINN